jgi:hypothetical protein
MIAKLVLGLTAAIVLTEMRVPVVGVLTVPAAAVFIAAELTACAGLTWLIVRQFRATLLWRPL